MLRPLYRCVLCLHPPGFRKRFADEMLSIFDSTVGARAALRVLADGLLSLFRQWTLRPEFWHEISPTRQPALDGVPSFYTLDPFRPRAGAVIHGLVLSTAIFGTTCFAIRYSWIHILHVRIREVQADRPRSSEPNNDVPAANSERTMASPGLGNKVPVSSSPSPSASVGAPPTPSSSPVQNRVAQNAMAQSSAAAHSQSQVSSEVPPMPGSAAESRRTRTAQSDNMSDLRAIPLHLLDRSSIVQAQSLPASAHDATTTSGILAAEDLRLNAADRERVIEGVVANLTKYYVDAAVAQKTAGALLTHETSGDDDAATTGEAFADLLTRQMMEVSHDKYLLMDYSTVARPENPPAPTTDEVARYRKEMEQNDCRIETTKILPHNIGYLKFNAFPDATVCGKTMAAAMTSLNNAEAIIFDLRDNRGGYANMVALIATYLFDRPTHLNDFYDRGENRTEQSWTLPPVPGNRLADKPVFVLTSPTTFSAAEGFSYDLKMLKRATLVGETTSGFGHMGMPHLLDDHFTIRIPGMRVINPISKTNWEGTGVEPDVKVKPADALAIAEKLAEKTLQQK